MTCPNCKSDVVSESAEGLLHCDACDFSWSAPAPSLEEELPAGWGETAEQGRARRYVGKIGDETPAERAARAKTTRERAEAFEQSAITLGLLGILLLLVAFVVILAAEGAGISYLSLAGGISCFWAAAWCYLLAQIIHTRANTEK